MDEALFYVTLLSDRWGKGPGWLMRAPESLRAKVIKELSGPLPAPWYVRKVVP